MSKLGHRSPLSPESMGGVLRWKYRVGEILELAVEVAPLSPDTGESTADSTLIGSPDPQLGRKTSHRHEARALGRWEWEGGRTY
jgi:hypothetical protein